VRIFLSFASEQRATAERIKYTLEESGHVVFFDGAELTGSQPFASTIADAVKRADLLVFLISPESVQTTRYPASELNMARALGRHPAGFVLPVMAAPVDRALIPPYLAAVSIFHPAADIATDVATEVSRIQRARERRWRRRFLAGGAVLGLLGAAAAVHQVGGDRKRVSPKAAVAAPGAPPAPNLAVTPRQTPPAEIALQVETLLEVHRGSWMASDAERDPRVRNGDQVQFDVTVSQPAFLYVFNWAGGDGTLTPLYPRPGGQSAVAPGAHVVLPEAGRFFKIHGSPGREEFFFISAPERVAELERLARDLGEAPERESAARGLQILTRGVNHASTAGSRLQRDRGMAGAEHRMRIREIATGAAAQWHRVALDHVR